MTRVGALNRARKLCILYFSVFHPPILPSLYFAVYLHRHRMTQKFFIGFIFSIFFACFAPVSDPSNIFADPAGHPIYKNNIVWCDMQRRFAILKGGFLGSGHVSKSKSFVLLFMILRLFTCDYTIKHAFNWFINNEKLGLG